MDGVIQKSNVKPLEGLEEFAFTIAFLDLPGILFEPQGISNQPKLSTVYERHVNCPNHYQRMLLQKSCLLIEI